MPSVPISIAPHLSLEPSRPDPNNPLPGLLHTPSGLAIIELQGTINFPSPAADDSSDRDTKRQRLDRSQDSAATAQSEGGQSSGDYAGAIFAQGRQATQVGKLVFSHYDPNAGKEDKAWMKRVYFYVGNHQRMTGEVKELTKPLAVLRRKQQPAESEGASINSQVQTDNHLDEGQQTKEELEIVEVVRYKIVFGSRPEPVGTALAE